jgi:hypothetical protein
VPAQVDESLRATVARLLGAEPRKWRAAVGGYTHNDRWIVELADGQSAFVKAAVDELSAGWLRDEHHIYSSVAGSFLPRLLGWAEEDFPVLLLEDLSDAHWPPPWGEEHVAALVATLDDVAATPCPRGLASAEDRREDLAGWTLVERDPAPFLELELCSHAWLGDALPDLVAAEKACVLGGDAFLHFDVRSDNVCFQGGRTLLVDWNWAVRGNPVVDVAAWLPSLEAEGGPPPEAILCDEREAAAFVSGFFAARAGLEPPTTAPRVREAQLAQLRSALPWTVRELGLPPLDRP